jgi:hypothetical protein
MCDDISTWFFILTMLVLQVQVLEKRLNDQFIMRCALEKALGYKPCAIHTSSENCIPKVKVLLLYSSQSGRAKKSVERFTILIYYSNVLLPHHDFFF